MHLPSRTFTALSVKGRPRGSSRTSATRVTVCSLCYYLALSSRQRRYRHQSWDQKDRKTVSPPSLHKLVQILASKMNPRFEMWHHKHRNMKIKENIYGGNLRKMYWMSLPIVNTSTYSPSSRLHGWAPACSSELICEVLLMCLLMCFFKLILFYSPFSSLVIWQYWWWWVVGGSERWRLILIWYRQFSNGLVC